jgi:hypothetical protein
LTSSTLTIAEIPWSPGLARPNIIARAPHASAGLVAAADRNPIAGT